MAYVNFGRKNTREEALASENKDKVFFPTDATSIILGGKEYGVVDLEFLTNDEIDDIFLSKELSFDDEVLTTRVAPNDGVLEVNNLNVEDGVLTV